MSQIVTSFIEILLAINCVLIIILGLCRILILKSSTSDEQAIQLTNFPKVSIHLPICNEPPSVVIKTIESILALNYSNFELIVLSNNTEDESVYNPVAQFCKDYPERVKFWHYDNVYGYKAGALNIALQYTHQLAKYIFIVDSDYCLSLDALDIAVQHIEKKNVDLVQFPQSYWNKSKSTVGLSTNYNHYFDCYMTKDTFKETCLPTGTLSIIKKSVFSQGYIWPTDSITEDANLGIDMLSKNLKISFSNIIIGEGLMPSTVNDYIKQYKRWLFGNFQTIWKLSKTSNINYLEKLKLSTLLTAWLNLLSFTFIVGIVVVPIFTLLKIDIDSIITILFLNISIHILIQATILHKLSDGNLKAVTNSIAIHLSTIDIGAFYWLTYFVNKKKPFVRTDKFSRRKKDLPKQFFYISKAFFIGALILISQDKLVFSLMYLLIAFVLYKAKTILISEVESSRNNINLIQLS